MAENASLLPSIGGCCSLDLRGSNDGIQGSRGSWRRRKVISTLLLPARQRLFPLANLLFCCFAAFHPLCNTLHRFAHVFHRHLVVSSPRDSRLSNINSRQTTSAFQPRGHLACSSPWHRISGPIARQTERLTPSQVNIPDRLADIFGPS